MAEEKEDFGILGEGGDDMGFLGHVEELRKRIIWAIIGIAVGCALTGAFYDFLTFDILLRPAKTANLDLQNFRPFGIPFLIFKVVFMSGLIISFPFVLYQIWKFIAPGLYDTERAWASKITFFTSLCFLGGVAFAYFVMIPQMLDFASKFGTEYIETKPDITEYFSFVTMMLLASGVIFELPMISYILGKVGLVNSKLMRKYWRHAIVVILILAAVLTPTPDPINQMFFAMPLLILYEISIWVVKISGKNVDE